MPEGRACRRAAVVRPAPEAGRELLGADGRGKPDGRKGGAQPGPDGRWRPREGGGERRGRRCTKPEGSDAAARPRRLQRQTPTLQISETMKRQPTSGKAEDLRPGN